MYERIERVGDFELHTFPQIRRTTKRYDAAGRMIEEVIEEVDKDGAVCPVSQLGIDWAAEESQTTIVASPFLLLEMEGGQLSAGSIRRLQTHLTNQVEQNVALTRLIHWANLLCEFSQRAAITSPTEAATEQRRLVEGTLGALRAAAKIPVTRKEGAGDGGR